jgi:DNA-3-methyladenine glycosylase I
MLKCKKLSQAPKETRMKNLRRCQWACDKLLIQYHDLEYGKIITDDNKLFEKLSLESFQAGLSWKTILAKRDNFREVFFKFRIDTVAGLSDAYLESLLFNEGIVCNRKKIFAVRQNALAAQKIIAAGQSFFQFVYGFCDHKKLCLAFKNAGFTFIGETMVQSFMQSIGLLPAHESCCFLYRQQSCEV